MNVIDIEFPVLCNYKGTIFTSSSCDAFTRTTTSALRGGLFDGLFIVDSNGKTYTVKSARILCGIGLCFGFNIFLNRTVRVDVEVEDNLKNMAVDEVRRLVLRDFRNWLGWESRGDFVKLKAAVAEATTVAAVIRLVAS